MLKEIILLGTGTSQGVPVIGCLCEVCLSADPLDKRLRTSCILKSATTTILVDPGPDFRQQALRIGLTKLDAIIVTHEHRDHTGGLDDLRALYHLNSKPIKIYSWPRILDRLKKDFAYSFSEKKYPGVASFDLIPISENRVMEGDLLLHIFPVLHYKLPVLAFKANWFAYATDFNLLSWNAVQHLRESTYLVIDCLQHREHISHLNLSQALDLIDILKPERAYFTHISHNLGLHSQLGKSLPGNIRLGYDGLRITSES